MALFQFGRKKKPVQKRGFDGAQGGRLFSDWVLQGMSADSEIRGNLNQLRVRCRDLANNDPYAKKYLRLLRDNVVGETGFNLQVQAKNDDGQLDEYGNDIIETQFKLWSQVGNCTADGKQSLADVTQMVIQGLARDGEVLIRKVFYPNNWGFALEILEPDLLDENLNATAPNGNAIRMGVEIDGYRRPVAYHLKSKHPGDNMAMASGQAIQRVEADKIIHLYDMERAQQTRGIPWMSNGVQSLKMLKGYREAEMVAKRVGAAKMGFFYSETGDEYVGDDYESGGENGHHGPKIMDAEPGTLTELPAGMRFEEFNPSNTSTEFQQFEKAILRGIASGWGVSYHSLANDLTQTSYSSIRQGTLEDRDFYKGLQKFIINHFLRPVYQSWLEQSFLTNAIPFSITKLDKFALSSMFRPRGFQWVDPAREIAAHIQALNSGLISMQDVANHYGRDVSETFAQIEKDKQLAEKFGLKLAFEPFGGGVSGYGPSKVDPETGEPVTDDQGKPMDKEQLREQYQEESRAKLPPAAYHFALVADWRDFDGWEWHENGGGDGIHLEKGITYVDDIAVKSITEVFFNSKMYNIDDVKAWLDGENLEAKEIDEVTGQDYMQVKDEEQQKRDALETVDQVQHRAAIDIEARAIEGDDRRVEMAISSEMPCERSFGNEVLVHSEETMNLDFLRSGRAPLLLDHDPTKQIGVIESVNLDAGAGVLRANVRFSRGELASEVYDDVVDGIRGNVSIGYIVRKMERDQKDVNTFRVTNFEILEASIVSIPADQSVGVGRSQELPTEEATEVPTEVEQSKVPVIEVSEVRTMDPIEVKGMNAAEAMAAIDLATRHNKREIADQAIRDGVTQSEFNARMLAAIGDKPLHAPEIDLTEKEQRQYSLMAAIRGAASGKLEGFEAEVNEELARFHGKEARGFYVPQFIFRDVTTGGTGGNLVGTDHLSGSFIEALQAKLVVSALGAQYMDGLVGDLAIPGMNASTNVGFVAENAAPATEGAPTFRQVAMSPKTMAQFVDIGRRLMAQSSPSAEAVIRNNMMRAFAGKLDQVALNGGGTNEPTGILQTSGIGSVAMGTNGGAITYAGIVDLEKAVADANALDGNMAYVTNPKVVGSMRQTPRQASGVEGNFILNDSNKLLGYDVMSTTNVPSNLTKGTGTDLSAAIFGNFQDLLIGSWGGLDVLVNPYASGGTGATRLEMYHDVDVAVQNAGSFAAIQDIDA